MLAVVAALAVPDVVATRRGRPPIADRVAKQRERFCSTSRSTATALDTSIWNTCHWWGDHGMHDRDPMTSLSGTCPEQVSVSDGALRLTADRDPTRGSDGKDTYRSGMVTTGPTEYDDSEAKVSWTYGTVEARLRVPAGRGLWPALWMLPARPVSPGLKSTSWRSSGRTRAEHHALPPERPERRKPVEAVPAAGRKALAEGWHTIRLDWHPERLTFFVDGKEVWRVTGDQVPDEPMYLVINLAVGGVYPGPPDRDHQVPGDI